MSHDPGVLPLGLEFELKRYWCGPGEMQTVHELPMLELICLRMRLLSNTCVRWLARSATYTLPCKSTAIPCGGLRPAAQHHQDLSLWIELDDQVRSLVNDPDVVLRIDTPRVRELEGIASLAKISTSMFAYGRFRSTSRTTRKPASVPVMAATNQALARNRGEPAFT